MATYVADPQLFTHFKWHCWRGWLGSLLIAYACECGIISDTQEVTYVVCFIGLNPSPFLVSHQVPRSTLASSCVPYRDLVRQAYCLRSFSNTSFLLKNRLIPRRPCQLTSLNMCTPVIRGHLDFRCMYLFSSMMMKQSYPPVRNVGRTPCPASTTRVTFIKHCVDFVGSQQADFVIFVHRRCSTARFYNRHFEDTA